MVSTGSPDPRQPPFGPGTTSADDARDMNQIRQDLGLGTLNYIGISYGTGLGAIYANLFPATVGHMVLDGNKDPVAWTSGGSLPEPPVRPRQGPRPRPPARRRRQADGGGPAPSRAGAGAGGSAAPGYRGGHRRR
ncbi:MAG: alpha/beta fold hydrolase [Trebonia sp.]